MLCIFAGNSSLEMSLHLHPGLWCAPGPMRGYWIMCNWKSTSIPPFSVKINLGVNDSGFASLDVYDKALYRPRREKMAAKGDCEEKQIVFLDSVILCFAAILRLLNRMYDYSLGFSVPEFSASLHRLISGPPKTLYDVMQFSILYLYAEEIGCERGRTLGPIDQMHWPYMQNDLKNGASMEEIKDLFRYFFLHFTAFKRFAQQPFTICGSNADGSDRSNELSLLLLDIYDELVDSLMMIKKYVYDRKELSLQELRIALAANWQGYEEVRLKIIKDEVKYGNGASGPDAIMEEITRHLGKNTAACR